MKADRLYYLDWFRILVVISLIPYHTSLTYTGYGDTYVTDIQEGISTIPLMIFQRALDPFFMTLLFFVAGCSAYYAMKKRSFGPFVKERSRRLLLPLLFGTFVLAPVQAYFKGLNLGYDGGFISFIPEFFSVKIVNYLGYAHLWFLLYLFILSCALYPLISYMSKGHRHERIVAYLIEGNHICLPLIWIILLETILRPLFPGFQTFIGDWANVMVYGTVYVYGYFFASDNKVQERIKGLFKTSTILSAASYIGMLAIFLYFHLSGVQAHPAYSVLWAMGKGIYEVFMIIMLTVLGSRYLNRATRLHRFLNQHSFNIYIWHFIPVSMLTYLFTQYDWNPIIEVAVITVAAFIVLFGISSGLMKLNARHL